MSPIPGIIASSITGGLSSTAFESIATVTGTGSSNTISFTNIPSGYKSLQIRYIGKSTQSGATSSYILRGRLNNISTTSYAVHRLNGNGSAVSATGNASITYVIQLDGTIPNSATALANMHGVGIIDIIDYASTTKNKTLRNFTGLDMNGATNGDISLSSGLWTSTNAITQIDLSVSTGSWTTTSTFALYGIK